MPIKDRSLYPANWQQVRADALERAGHRCEMCKAPNHETIERNATGDVWRDPSTGEVFCADSGEYVGCCRPYEFDFGRSVRVVLTTAHLFDPTPSNVDPDNIAALCQRCHLRLDSKLHRANAQATRRAKAATGELF